MAVASSPLWMAVVRLDNGWATRIGIGGPNDSQLCWLPAMEPCDLPQRSAPGVFLFNPFAEGFMAHGRAFTPVRHQVLLATDLANLPQFLAGPGDIVLVPRRPSTRFLHSLEQAGLALPEFVELKHGRITDTALSRRTLGRLRPWAWGPDSLQLLAPLFGQVTGEPANPSRYFNDNTARLYSKSWSAEFLRRVLPHLSRVPGSGFSRPIRLCSPDDIGVSVSTLPQALSVIAAIRTRGHHRVVVKQAHGLAGQSAIRLWEPELLPPQQQWLTRALGDGRQLVVEPWLERELDFSVQMEMGANLKLCGYTGLINDLRGQFLANWAEPNCRGCPPARLTELFAGGSQTADPLQQVYGHIMGQLETELRHAGFTGPVSIDAFVYRDPQGDCRLKPVVEINPRYTMGRLTLELMRHTSPGQFGFFRLVSLTQAKQEGFSSLGAYAHSLAERLPLDLEPGDPAPPAWAPSIKIRHGALCLNDPDQAQVCLAVFQVSRTLPASGLAGAGLPVPPLAQS